MPRNIYKHIKENHDRVFIGYQSCKAWDIINIKPCLKSGRSGHSTRKCYNEVCCLNCAEANSTSQCNNTNKEVCINCLYTNKKFNTNLYMNHKINDTEKCVILKKKIDKYINMTDYPTRPTLPRYIGNLLLKEQISTENLSDKNLNSQSSPIGGTTLPVVRLKEQTSTENLSDKNLNSQTSPIGGTTLPVTTRRTNPKRQT